MSGKASKRTVGSARRFVLVALLGVLVMGAVSWVALAASTVPAPTITAKPANPTASTSASFSFSGTPSGGGYQCALDGSAFAVCSSPKTYAGLASGSHAFQVRSTDKTKFSDPVAYTWVVDAVAPTASIVRLGASPTNASSVQWTVSFSEPVTGVDPTDFALVKTGISGASTAVTVAGSGASYTVSMASTGSGDGSVGLNVVDNDSIKDGVLNSLGGAGAGNGSVAGPVFVIDKTPPTALPTITSGPSGLVNSSTATFTFTSSEPAYRCQLDGGAFTVCTSPQGYSGLANGSHTFQVRTADAAGNVAASGTSRTWTVDTIAPPAPVLTLKPPDPSSTATSRFAWTDAEAGVTFQCSIENGPWMACSTPFTFEVAVTTDNNGQHQFAVRAIDPAGNPSAAATYTWKVIRDSPQDFVINGSVSGLAPGVQKSIPVTITNPNSVPIFVSQLSVTVAAGSGSGTCATSTYTVTGWTAAGTAQELQIPANATNFAVPLANQPKIKFNDSASNQDNCKGKSFSLSFSGTAHS